MANAPAKRPPRYYTTLRPFLPLLQQGSGVLTYHHVGPRPRGARLKGLYVSPSLFVRQMNELKESGFVAPSYDELTGTPEATQRRIFITFDDGYQDVFDNALPVLIEIQFKSIEFKAIQFLVADFLGRRSHWQEPSGEIAGELMGIQIAKMWLAAGQQIGSHTLRHPFLTRISLAEAREEITASKKKLEDIFGVPVDHFCYPYGDFNESIRELVREAGYKTACTTQFGINQPQSDPLSLRRITARYRSRSLRDFRSWVPGLFRT